MPLRSTPNMRRHGVLLQKPCPHAVITHSVKVLPHTDQQSRSLCGSSEITTVPLQKPNLHCTTSGKSPTPQEDPAQSLIDIKKDTTSGRDWTPECRKGTVGSWETEAGLIREVNRWSGWTYGWWRHLWQYNFHESDYKMPNLKHITVIYWAYIPTVQPRYRVPE